MAIDGPHAVEIAFTTSPHSGSGACTLTQVTTPVVIAINPTKIDVHHTLKIRLHYPNPASNFESMITVRPLKAAG
jgi:hypothetical protein